MRIIKIGRDPSCDIVLNSNYVSSIHAELTLLNNGDMMLEDKGSSNHTFIQNQPIKPNTPVSVKRGDAIRFANVELQWSQVPMPEDNSGYKGIYSIGSHFNNDMQIAGNTVSRYHATIKQAKDGKMYIVDHSKNGTTVNGAKIAPNTLTPIKRSSAIVCGGVPVDTSNLPWPSPLGKYIMITIAAAAVLVGIIFGVKAISSHGHVWDAGEIYDHYSSSVVMMLSMQHYEVSAGSFDLSQMGIDTKFGYTVCTGTGFFVSEDGQIVTNLHVVRPWLFDNTIQEMEEKIRIQVAKIAELRAAVLPQLGITPEGLTALLPQIKVTGVSDGVMFVPQGKFFSKENAVECRVLSAGDDPKVDVALIQSDKMELPNRKCTFVNVTDSIDTGKDALKVGTTMFTLGFPHGPSLQDEDNEKGLQVFCHMGHITRDSDQYTFNFDAVSASGASGSPVFNDHGMLIGILNAGVTKENINCAIKARYIKELIEGEHHK